MLRVLDMVFVAKGQDGTVEALAVGDDEDFGSLLAGIAPFGAENAGRQAAGNGAAGETAAAPLLQRQDHECDDGSNQAGH